MYHSQINDTTHSQVNQTINPNHVDCMGYGSVSVQDHIGLDGDNDYRSSGDRDDRSDMQVDGSAMGCGKL